MRSALTSWGYHLLPWTPEDTATHSGTFRISEDRHTTVDYIWCTPLPAASPQIHLATHHWDQHPTPSPHAILSTEVYLVDPSLTHSNRSLTHSNRSLVSPSCPLTYSNCTPS